MTGAGSADLRWRSDLPLERSRPARRDQAGRKHGGELRLRRAWPTLQQDRKWGDQNAGQEQVGSTVNPVLTGLGIDQRFARNDVNGRSYYLTDHLGNTRALTDASGNVTQRYD